MPETQYLEQAASTMVRLRRIFLIVSALAYIGGMGACALLYTGNFNPYRTIVIFANWICWPIWLASSIASVWLIFRLRKHRAVGRLIDDERTLKYVHLSFQVSYWALLILTGGLLGLSFIIHVEARAVLAGLLACGVAVAPLTYAFSYRA